MPEAITTPAPRAATLAIASFLVFAGWEVFRKAPHPFRDLSSGHYTDHLSHLNSARLLPRVGLGIWRQPLPSLLRPLTPAERERLPADVRTAAWPRGEAYFVPGWPADKPMIASWSFNPRFYPPGDAVLFAPVALAYHFTPLTFTGANLFALLLLLAYAHVSLYVALRSLDGSPLEVLSGLVVFFPLIHWTLEGFYDGALIAPLLVSARQLRARRGVEALLAFCIAAVIHFRAFFFAPWALAAVAQIVRERQWRRWGWRGWTMAIVSLVLAAATLIPFALLQPWFRNLGYSNQVALGAGPAMRPLVIAFAAAVFLAAILLWRDRAAFEMVMLAWIGVMLLSLHQAEQWHSVALLPWLCAPVAARHAAPAAQARLWFVICASAMVFRESIAPLWLAQLF